MNRSEAGERARLFVALELPESARAALEHWRTGAVTERAGLRPVRQEALHVTLCFLGWRAEGEIDPIGTACEVSVRGRARLQLSFGEALWLPARRPHVLTVRIEEQSGALADLQASVSEAMSEGGWYERESRPFLGHVTVARLGKSARVSGVELPPVPATSFGAVTVTLFRSRLERGGARYEALRRIELGCEISHIGHL